MAKFSRKAQCELWTGRDAPGGLRAEARGGGTTRQAAFCGPELDGDRDRDRPPRERQPVWARGGTRLRGTCCKKKRKKKASSCTWGWMSLQA